MKSLQYNHIWPNTCSKTNNNKKEEIFLKNFSVKILKGIFLFYNLFRTDLWSMYVDL